MPRGVEVPRADVARTMSVVRELSAGKMLTLPDGKRIAMGADMSIGPVIEVHGEETVAGLATMDLCELNDLLDRHGIGDAVPSHVNT
jgi:hypothetical protein